MRNAMDAQEVAVGWWPGDARYPRAAFYAYAHPAPPGFAATESAPNARWDDELGEFILDWDDVRSSGDPRAAALHFARSVFRHACSLCTWDRDLAASAEGIPPPSSESHQQSPIAFTLSREFRPIPARSSERQAENADEHQDLKCDGKPAADLAVQDGAAPATAPDIIAATETRRRPARDPFPPQ